MGSDGFAAMTWDVAGEEYGRAIRPYEIESWNVSPTIQEVHLYSCYQGQEEKQTQWEAAFPGAAVTAHKGEVYPSVRSLFWNEP